MSDTKVDEMAADLVESAFVKIIDGIVENQLNGAAWICLIFFINWQHYRGARKVIANLVSYRASRLFSHIRGLLDSGKPVQKHCFFFLKCFITHSIMHQNMVLEDFFLCDALARYMEQQFPNQSSHSPTHYAPAEVCSDTIFMQMQQRTRAMIGLVMSGKCLQVVA